MISPQLQRTIVKLPTQNFTVGPKGRPLDYVIIHATAGGFSGSVDWLRNSNRPKRSSAHYVIDKAGGVVQLVREDDFAWHAGYGRWNGRGSMNRLSIGIELENSNTGTDPYPRPQIEAALYLTLRALVKHKRKSSDVLGHNQVDPERKTDPAGFLWNPFLFAIEENLKKFESRELCEHCFFS